MGQGRRNFPAASRIDRTDRPAVVEGRPNASDRETGSLEKFNVEGTHGEGAHGDVSWSCLRRLDEPRLRSHPWLPRTRKLERLGRRTVSAKEKLRIPTAAERSEPPCRERASTWKREGGGQLLALGHLNSPSRFNSPSRSSLRGA